MNSLSPINTIIHTEAIALRVSPYSRTSCVITWLTRGHGIINTAVKGAYRPKSMFLGQMDQFYTCDILFYARERNGFHNIREFSPLNPRTPLRSRWQGFMCASHLADLVIRTTPPLFQADLIYDLLSQALDACMINPSLLLVDWFEIRLAMTTGIAPGLSSCVLCSSQNAVTHATDCAFSVREGGILCPSCRKKSKPSYAAISSNIITAMRRLSQAQTPLAIKRINCPAKQLLVLHEIIGRFIEYHMDTRPPGRDIISQALGPEEKHKERTSG